MQGGPLPTLPLMNKMLEAITIGLGLAEQHRWQAARLYYDAFAPYLDTIIGSRERAIRIIAQDIKLEPVITGTLQDQLVGLIGLKHGGRFVDFRRSTFVKELGWLRGRKRYNWLRATYRPSREGELLLDGICVHPDWRGQGIGTQLIQVLFEFAYAYNYTSIRLDVIDTNSGARRLYERLDFVATDTLNFDLLSRMLFSYSAVTTMIYQID